jgi:crossover junction endodeoxyribonuclease RuvC
VTTRVIGVDPAIRQAGYGVVDVDGDRITYVECGTFEFDQRESVEVRLAQLSADLIEVVDEFGPALAGIEHAHVGKNPQSALRLAEARGVCTAVFAERGIVVENYQPSEIKLSATGNGRANKAQVRAILMRQLRISREPKFDASDALAVAVCRARRLRGG